MSNSTEDIIGPVAECQLVKICREYMTRGIKVDDRQVRMALVGILTANGTVSTQHLLYFMFAPLSFVPAGALWCQLVLQLLVW